MAKRQLTDRQKRFVDEYLVDLNGSAAARRAGYSTHTAGRLAQDLLAKRHIAELIAKRQRDLQRRVGVTQEQVVNELVRIAFGDQRRVVSWGPDGVVLRRSDDLTDDEAAAVAEVAQTTTQGGGSLRIKAHDKVRALELLGKHLGLFEADNRRQVDGTVEIVRRIVDARDDDGA